MYSNQVDKSKNVKCDQIIKLKGKKLKLAYPEKLRRIKYYNSTKNKTYIYLTNNFELDAFTVTKLYKNRWQIELFFQLDKATLKNKKVLGTYRKCGENTNLNCHLHLSTNSKIHNQLNTFDL